MFDIFSVLVALVILATLVIVLLLSYVYTTAPLPNMACYESEKFFEDPNKDGEKEAFPSLDDAPSLELSVIVPAYNEEDRITVMLEEAVLYLEGRQEEQPSFTYEIIIVDDGSKDKTTKIALEYSKKYGTGKVRVLTLEKNRGKGGAIRRGMLRGRGKLLMFADADGATKFADLEKLENQMREINMQEDNMAVVCGSRAHLEQDSIAERSMFRTILMYGFHFLVQFLCVREIKDTQCGFKLFTRDAARLLFHIMHVDRWAFDVDLLHIAQHYKLPVAEVAVNWQEIEGSKLSPFWAALQMFRDLFLIRLRYLTGVWKMDYKPKSQ